MNKRIWDDFLTDRDKLVFEKSGYGVRAGFGDRPVLLIIDVNYNFLGHKPETIIKSIDNWPNSCGEDGWIALKKSLPLIEAARKKQIPIIYTTGEVRPDKWDRGSWAWKNSRTSKKIQSENFINMDPNTIIPDIEPQASDVIIKKIKPSAFYGTNLQSFLNLFSADSLIIIGTTTSGCVRATVLDGFSANYRITVVEDCCFDRSEASHAINLCDMNAKYADVVISNEVIEYLENLDIYEDSNFINWKTEWESRLKRSKRSEDEIIKMMRSVNPVVVPRNHKVEEILRDAETKEDYSSLKKLLKFIKYPYYLQDGIDAFQASSGTSYKEYKTFCGT